MRSGGIRRAPLPDTTLAYETNNWSPRLADFYDPPVRAWPPLTEQLDAAAAAGFGCFVLDSGSLAAFVRETGSLRALRGAAEERGLRCLAVAEISIVEDVNAVIAAARPLLDAVRALEAQFLQASVMGNPAHCLESARALEQLAAASGARLALEFLPFSAVNGITVAQEFMRRAELCNTRLLLDSWHFLQGQCEWDALRLLAPGQIAYVQFSDHGSTGPDKPLHATVNERVMPGEGVLELERFCAALREIGFDGVMSCEVLSSAWRERSPLEYARAEIAAARRYLAPPAGLPRDSTT